MNGADQNLPAKNENKQETGKRNTAVFAQNLVGLGFL